ncbi:MAG: DUF1841 family protein [Betaproteobacteria bacterium]
MFNPSKDEVRRFFCDAWARHRGGGVLTPLEAIAVDWIRRHPEYQDELADTAAAVARDYSIDEGRTNPFLHLSMHLAIAEQLSVDQPPGIRIAYQRLVERRGDEHAAAHAVMDCLGEIVWAAQRAGSALPPDEMTARYLDCLERKASRD